MREIKDRRRDVINSAIDDDRPVFVDQYRPVDIALFIRGSLSRRARRSRFGKFLSIPGNAVFSTQVSDGAGNIKSRNRALHPHAICHTRYRE